MPRQGKKEQILQTGRRLFLEWGIGATSMDDIAEAVPVSKMTLYNYFGSKEGLVEAVIGEITEQTKERFYRLVREAGSPLEVLAGLTKTEDFQEVPEPLVVELLEEYPETAKKLMQYYASEVYPVFENVIFQGQQQGQIRRDISPHVLMQFLMALKDFMAKPERLKGIGDLQAVSNQMITLLYYGIIAPEHKDHFSRSLTDDGNRP
jgi:AcrR family transcriptional regulator